MMARRMKEETNRMKLREDENGREKPMKTKRQNAIQDAIIEARRFIERAESAHKAMDRDEALKGGPKNSAMHRTIIDLRMALTGIMQNF